MRLKQLLLGFAVLLSISFMVPGSAVAAWNPFDGACNDASADSAVCKDAAQQKADSKNSDPLTGPDGLIMDVANVVAIVAGAASVIIIILAGLRMITSSGSSDDIAGARRALIYAVVGLVVISLSRVIVGYIIGSL